MDAATIVKLLIIVGIMLNVISIGVRARPADALALVLQPALAGRAMLAMFVLVPAFVLLLTVWLDLPRPVAAVLLALSVAPMPPLISNKEIGAGGEASYAIGLQVLATAFSLIAMPIMLAVSGMIFGKYLPFDPTAMVMVLALTVAVPMAIGMAVGHFLPNVIPVVASWGSRIGWIGIGLGAGALVLARWGDIAARVGGGTLIVCIVIVAFALLVGQWLGGPVPGNRSALAITCAARHPGVAISVVSGLFPEDSAAILGMTGLFFLTSFAMTVVYLRWRHPSDAP
jgi:BASS family bile acid:Na+ symporter